MQPLGLQKMRHKVAGHGDWCPICTSMLKRQLHRRRPREYGLSETGRAREKNRRRREDRDLGYVDAESSSDPG